MCLMLFYLHDWISYHNVTKIFEHHTRFGIQDDHTEINFIAITYMHICIYMHIHTYVYIIYIWRLPCILYNSIKATQFRYILHRSSRWPNRYTWMHSIDHSGTELEASVSSWWFILGRIKIARSELGHRLVNNRLVNPGLFWARRGSIQLQRTLSGCRLPGPYFANMDKL